ncbi:MAG: protein mobD [Synergistaceae bacterium]|nr:protein mobD [Synergistaceae bacterium]
MRSLYFVTGGKGGVGKSILSMLLVDFLTQYLKKKIILIESDTSNPDVGKTFVNNDDVEVIFLSLDNADGWIELVNYCETKDRDIVINFAARSGEAIKKFAGTLIGSLEELNTALITFWLINRQRDSVELLKEYMEAVQGELHVVRNTFYGEPHKFELFNNSKIRSEVEKRGATIDCPDLADRVADDLYSGRLSIAKAAVEMPLGNRAELKRWRSIAWKMFDDIGIGKAEEKAS